MTTMTARIPIASLLLLLSIIVGGAALQQPSRGFSRRSFIASSASAGAVATTGQLSFPSAASAAYIDPAQAPLEVTKRAYLDIQIGDDALGRIVVGLYGEAMPRAAENFASLAGSNGYADTLFYRVISDLSIQGGAIGDAVKGRKGKSAFGNGEPFEPDNFKIMHSKKGLVSAVRTADGKIDSRFFIQTVEDGGIFDDRYAVFGVVDKGMKFVEKINTVEVQPPQNGPKVPVKIIKSGIL